ncbi:MAG TPA: FAD-dependent oxidoreductase [Vicinamibacteria bacterium]|nr:FAD-dependent oxidoreductase [Vicinamibacteria bacterium]
MREAFDDNRSIWLSGKPPYESAPPLGRDVVLDVAIIGGGFTGVSTAYHLSKRYPERGIAILEARTIANGASGRNGGQMLNWVQGVDNRDLDQAKKIYAITQEGIEGILSLIDEHHLEVPHRRDGHLDVFTSDESAEAGQAEVERLRTAGLPLRFLGVRELRDYIELEGATGAVLDPGGGQLDGVAFLRGLRPVLESRGVRVYESTPVTRVREGSTVELETPRGRVRAKAVVLATNAYTPHLGYFRNALVPLLSHVVATDRQADPTWQSLGWKKASGFTDDRGRLSYGTLTSSGQLLFGGGSNESYDYVYANGTRLPNVPSRAFEACRGHLESYLPRVKDVPLIHRWSGPVALTMSRLCTMGARGTHKNVYFALGYSGHGVTLANLAGRVLTDVYSGQGERWEGYPFYQQKLRFIPPEPFRWLGYHLYTRLTGRSPRSGK